MVLGKFSFVGYVVRSSRLASKPQDDGVGVRDPHVATLLRMTGKDLMLFLTG